MTHVSRKRLPDKTREVLEKAIIFVFSNLDSQQVSKILSSLFTNTERTMLSKRLGILFLARQNLTDIEIAETVKTTRQTVARIQLQLLGVPNQARDFLYKKLIAWNRISLLKSLAKEAATSILKRMLRPYRSPF